MTTDVDNTAGLIAEKNTRELAIIAESIDRTYARQFQNFAAAGSAVQGLLAETEAMPQQETVILEQLAALKVKVTLHGTETLHLKGNMAEAHAAGMLYGNQQLEELRANLHRLCQQVDEAFWAEANIAWAGLDQAEEIIHAINRIADANRQYIDDFISEIADDIDDLHRDISQLADCLEHIQEGLDEQTETTHLIDEEIYAMSSLDYVQQELDRLQALIIGQPDPVIDIVLPIVAQLKENYANSMAQVEKLNLKDYLLELQNQLQDSSVDAIDQQLDRIESSCEDLKTQSHALSQSKEATKASALLVKKPLLQTQLQRLIRRVNGNHQKEIITSHSNIVTTVDKIYKDAIQSVRKVRRGILRAIKNETNKINANGVHTF